MRRRRQCGRALLEAGVAAAVFACLVGVGVERLGHYLRRAETAAARQFVVSLRSALALKMAHGVASGSALVGAGDNPIGWLAAPPPNYMGEYFVAPPPREAGGHWYFDRARQILVFVHTIRHTVAFEPLLLLKFKVESTRLPDEFQPVSDQRAPSAPALVEVFD